MSCYCDSLSSEYAITDGIKFKKDFLASAMHNVRVLVEVCSYIGLREEETWPASQRGRVGRIFLW